ncbi:zinc finger protein 765 [Anopheles nili]|uniref:zinc finger protein 765 n=1 Tax=Anopheles nili TaxID=185578 RepID=UPI00237B4883|nr:zinc finger protein 765 [Anopheles nili]
MELPPIPPPIIESLEEVPLPSFVKDLTLLKHLCKDVKSFTSISLPNFQAEDIATAECNVKSPSYESILNSKHAVICTVCDFSTATSVEMAQHYIAHHAAPVGWETKQISTEKLMQCTNYTQKYVCASCGVRVFDSIEDTKRHMIDDHGLRRCIDKEGSTETKQISTPKSHGSRSFGVISSGSSRARSNPSINSRTRSHSSSSSEWEPNNSKTKKMRPVPMPLEVYDQEEYLRKVTLKSLIETYRYENSHRCSRKGCQFKFASCEIRDQHLRCHAEIDPASVSLLTATGGTRKRFCFKCLQCDRKFDSWKPCLEHMWREHQTDLGMLRCPLCEKRFSYAVVVFKHLQTHRSKEMRDVACRMCDKKFANKSQRSVHEALHQKKEGQHDELTSTGEKPRWYSERRCNICNHMFSNSKILSKHIKTVHLNIKPFVCNVCSYKCARKATLNIHIRQHSGLKPLACKLCSFRTADPSTLSYHVRRHRQIKSYQCKVCGIKLVQPGTLRSHIQTQHPAEYSRMKCTLCDFASVNPQNLERHQANHQAGLIKITDEDSRPDGVNESRDSQRIHPCVSTIGRHPETSSDCFLPLESVDSVVHDTGGITIPAAVVTVPAALSEETQFPI